jgi:hypothetical protein
MLDDQEHRLNRGLPLLELLFGLRELLDIFGGFIEGDDLAAPGQRDRIIERAFPASVSHQRATAAAIPTAAADIR